jgi:hypothetical protein
MGNSNKDQLNQGAASNVQILNEHDRALAESNKGIGDTQARVNELTPRSDEERQNIISGYNGLAANGGISDADRASLLGTAYGAQGTGVNSGPVGGGGVNTAPGAGDDYLNTFNQISKSATGGMNLDDTNKAVSGLANAQGDYTNVDTSIKGLQDFAATGGVSAEDAGKIDNPTLEEFSRTGGYDEQAKQNVRSRGNAGIASMYGNLQDQLNIQKMRASGIGPGWGDTGFKLARQGAQAIGQQGINTEADLNDRIITNRQSAASTLADKIQALAALKSQNTLTGYTSSGQLGNTRASQLEQALAESGQLGLSREQGVANARLSAAGGLSQDTLGRMSIGAQSAAAAAQVAFQQRALDATNQRFLINEGSQAKMGANRGLLDTYATAPGELTFDQNLLRGYRSDAANEQLGLVNASVANGANFGRGGGPSTAQTLATVGGTVAGGYLAGGGLSGGGGGNTGGIIRPLSSTGVLPVGGAYDGSGGFNAYGDGGYEY